MALAMIAAGATAEITPASFDLVGDAEAAKAPSRLDVPYDGVVQRTIHNAYARREPLFDQLAWHDVRSLEIDVHTSRAGERARAGDWFVFHEDVPLARESSCATLASCLAEVQAFRRAVPDHEVLTLFVDIKDGFPAGHTPADLDGALASALGPDSLVTPESLLSRCPGARSVRDAVAGRCRFPSGRELRGKVIVAVTGGSACERASAVSTYAGEGSEAARARSAFAASDADAGCPVEQLEAARFDHVVFVNMSFDERARAAQVRARGLVGRVYYGGLVGGLDTDADFLEARRSGAQLLATDAVNADADRWAIPVSPSTPVWQGPGVREAEAGDFALLEARSGALGSERDSFFFAFDRSDVRQEETWSAIFSVPSSHVEAKAETCLMARASTGDDAPFAALCRPFDEGAPRLVVRTQQGGRTTARELDPASAPLTTAESHALFRLHVEAPVVLPRGLVATHVIAESSADGVTWTPVGAASVAGELPLRGVAAASHGDASVRALVGHLTRTREGEDVALRPRDLGEQVAIGARATGHFATPVRAAVVAGR